AIVRFVPEDGLRLAATVPSMMSAAETLTLAAATPVFGSSLVMFAGTLTTGGVVSWTVTVKEPLRLLPARSAALQLTVVVPRANVDPEAGEQALLARPEPPALSAALVV